MESSTRRTWDRTPSALQRRSCFTIPPGPGNAPTISGPILLTQLEARERLDLRSKYASVLGGKANDISRAGQPDVGAGIRSDDLVEPRLPHGVPSPPSISNQGRPPGKPAAECFQ